MANKPKLKISSLLATKLLDMVNPPTEREVQSPRKISESAAGSDDKKKENQSALAAAKEYYIACLKAKIASKEYPKWKQKVDEDAFMTLHRQTKLEVYKEIKKEAADKHKVRTPENDPVLKEIENDPSFDPGQDDGITFGADGSVKKISASSKLSSSQRAQKVCQSPNAKKGISFTAGRPTGMINGKLADAIKNGTCPTYDLAAQSDEFTRQIFNDLKQPMLKKYAFTNHYNQVDTIVDTGAIAAITPNQQLDAEFAKEFKTINDKQINALKKTEAYKKMDKKGKLATEVMVTTANFRRCLGDSFSQVAQHKRKTFIQQAFPKAQRVKVLTHLHKLLGKKLNEQSSYKDVSILDKKRKLNEIESSTKQLQALKTKATSQQKRYHSEHTNLSEEILTLENSVRQALNDRKSEDATQNPSEEPSVLKKLVQRLLALYNKVGHTKKYLGMKNTSLLTASGKARKKACYAFTTDSTNNDNLESLKNAMNKTPSERIKAARTSQESMQFGSTQENNYSPE